MNKQYFQGAASATLLVDVIVSGLDEERPVGALQLPYGKLLARRHVEQPHLQNISGLNQWFSFFKEICLSKTSSE